jgi:hypothetical protein
VRGVRGVTLTPAQLIKDQAADCCQDCADLPACNVWVFCEGDCVNFAYHSCWLKRTSIGGGGRATPLDHFFTTLNPKPQILSPKP